MNKGFRFSSMLRKSSGNRISGSYLKTQNKQKPDEQSTLPTLSEKDNKLQELWQSEPKTYKERDRIIRFLRYKSYSDYLASELWYNIRTRVYKLQGTKCFVCTEPANCIHHRSYDIRVLLGECIDQNKLIPLCNTCHTIVERHTNGRKRTLLASRQRLKQLITDRKSS